MTGALGKNNRVRKIENAGVGLPFLMVVRVGLIIEKGAFEQIRRRGSTPCRYLDICKRMW